MDRKSLYISGSVRACEDRESLSISYFLSLSKYFNEGERKGRRKIGSSERGKAFGKIEKKRDGV